MRNTYTLQIALLVGLYDVFCPPVKLSVLRVRYHREMQKQQVYTRNLLRKHTPGARDVEPVADNRRSLPVCTHAKHVILRGSGAATKPTQAKPNRAGNNINVIRNRNQLDVSRLKSKQILAHLAMIKGLIARV